ncbi:mitochondrial potassium channel ATP-binding subunit-like isoform 3-T4 [Salvelinus alpinus]
MMLPPPCFTLVRALSSGARVFEYLSLEPPFPRTGCGRIPDKSLTGWVDFMKVTFSYPMRPGQQILKNFNLIIPLSKTVAIVGESGGKSTVASLLELFFDPSSGVIMLYGLDIWTLDPSQRTNNLIHQSGACRFLTGFPGGYNPVVGIFSS